MQDKKSYVLSPIYPLKGKDSFGLLVQILIPPLIRFHSQKSASNIFIPAGGF